MKLLLSLLLLPSICLAQNNFVKVTAYRFIETYNDGPCSIISYLNQEEYKNAIATASSLDTSLPRKLVNFREAVIKGKSLAFHCSERWIGGDIIDAVIILDGKQKDTLFFSERRNLLVIPKHNKAYKYAPEKLMSILNPEMTNFFKKDFEGEQRKLFLGER